MNWNDTVFACLCKVNRNLHNGFTLTERAERLLTRMESCLCSGDGLSRGTAFKASDRTVVDRTLELLGVRDAVSGVVSEDGVSVYSLGGNPWGVNALYFIIGTPPEKM